MTTPIYVGCAGWSLPTAQQENFPPEGTHLERYAQILPAVEINSSFYRSHLPQTYARWSGSVPAAFRFSAKVPREITHRRRLKHCEEPTMEFLDQVKCLGNRLGCLLVQLPPSLRYDAQDAERFFTLLRIATVTAIACEPRHSSWFSAEATALLSSFGIGRVEADPAPVKNVEPYPDAALAYLRLHGSPVMYQSAYTARELDALAIRLAQLRNEKKQVWCVFDNTASGAALPNALSLLSRLLDG